jgi:hypothetical protein
MSAASKNTGKFGKWNTSAPYNLFLFSSQFKASRAEWMQRGGGNEIAYGAWIDTRILP